eukprot:gene18098-19907_t
MSLKLLSGKCERLHEDQWKSWRIFTLPKHSKAKELKSRSDTDRRYDIPSREAKENDEEIELIAIRPEPYDNSNKEPTENDELAIAHPSVEVENIYLAEALEEKRTHIKI